MEFTLFGNDSHTDHGTWMILIFLLFSLPEGLYDIWLQMAKRFQRRCFVCTLC